MTTLAEMRALAEASMYSSAPDGRLAYYVLSLLEVAETAKQALALFDDEMGSRLDEKWPNEWVELSALRASLAKLEEAPRD